MATTVVELRIVYKINLLTFKCINGLTPKYLQELLDVYKPNRSPRSSTYSIRLNLPLYNMKSYKLRSFSVSGPRLWNELPSELRAIKSVIIFKAKLKTHLFKHILLNFCKSVFFIIYLFNIFIFILWVENCKALRTIFISATEMLVIIIIIITSDTGKSKL